MEIIVGFIIVHCIVVAGSIITLTNLNSPIITRKAQIVRKYSEQSSGDSNYDYYVVFEFCNGQSEKLESILGNISD